MNVEFDTGGDQIDGARDYQEDAFMVSHMGETPDGKATALIIMADGMGGHAAGNVASNMVVATFNKAFQSSFPPKNPSQVLNDALLISNEQIATSVKETPALAGMGCTMVSAYLEGNELWWVSVGDSHLYLIRDKELIKQNADHSYGAFIDMMKEQGEEVDENSGMSRNMLMSAMTGVEISSIDCPDTSIKVQPGDRIIVASDGLDTIGSGAIIQYSAWSDTPKECAYALLKAVEDVKRKKQDNTTVIIIDIRESKKAADPKPEPKAPLSTEEPKQLGKKSRKRVTDLSLEDNEKESSGIFLKLLIVIILFGGGYLAWVSGLIDDGLSSVSEILTKDVTADSEPFDHQTKITTPIITANKAPVYNTPRKPPKIKQHVNTKPLEIESKPFQDTMKNGSKAPLMITIPQGSFRMGGATTLISPDEAPRHDVSIKTFAMSQNEVSFAEYELFANAVKKKVPNNKTWAKSKHPVNQVSWDDALEYTQWLSQQTGFKYRLPSEAEWEYAARATSSSVFWWGNAKGVNNAQCFDCGSDLNPNKPAKSGSFKANKFGLYDMLGNVFEWTHDCYHKNYNNAPNDGSVWEGGNCNVRVARGGAFASPASSMRVSNREKFKSNQGRDHVGIRVVRAL